MTGIEIEYIRKGRKVKNFEPKYNRIEIINASTGFINEINRYVLKRDYADCKLIAVTNFNTEGITVLVIKER